MHWLFQRFNSGLITLFSLGFRRQWYWCYWLCGAIHRPLLIPHSFSALACIKFATGIHRFHHLAMMNALGFALTLAAIWVTSALVEPSRHVGNFMVLPGRYWACAI